jgi:hypothetical protein
MGPYGRHPGEGTERSSFQHTQRDHSQVPLGDLVLLFQEEAQKVSLSESEANLLASQALLDFLQNYGRNVKIS